MLTVGEETRGHELSKESTGVESLSPELRALLSNEMLALQNGMMSIIPAYASGNWGEIERVADKMKHSYLLKQSLTAKQVNELHTLLPGSFITLDQRFHSLSGLLSLAAKNKNAELAGFYFYKLGEACVGCHRLHADHKFPALALPKEIHEQMHKKVYLLSELQENRADKLFRFG